MKKSGIILKMADGRHVAILSDQPLFKTEKKMILKLLDENFKETGKQLIKAYAEYLLTVKAGQLIGYIN